MKRSDLPSLDDLRAFETVARHGSMRGAAEELALTHGAVSRRVAKLSKDLDLQLITPDGRGIALTPEGAKLAQTTEHALQMISTTLSSLRKVHVSQPIVVSCERSVAMRWLIPRLSQFQSLHPKIPVHLSVGGGPLNLSEDGVTFAIRRLDFSLPPEWSVETLFEESMGPVMQPSMKRAFQAGGYIGLGSKTRPGAWDKWIADHPSAPKPNEIRLFDHHFLMAEAAASGLGVALCPKVVAIDDISRGRLVAPEGFVPDGSSYGLISAKTRSSIKETQTFANWIKEISALLV
ncbi:transcriptional regulator [Pseudovibrio japonicus]|uniref:Transcriptional regulator n=1 Tax=Pseudovibrio japonicus TaxID=366534 RepID=A0ABQ3ERU3_9HYPH|nr:LysR family transcriptional regulator [Pseudovibrio japonicus]GHB50607.1 transcriptional regulator [Pseudovibrio japonicus]